jgi:hypothetical protein
VLKELQEHKEQQVLKVLQVLKELQEHKEQQVHKELQEHKDLQDLKVQVMVDLLFSIILLKTLIGMLAFFQLHLELPKLLMFLQQNFNSILLLGHLELVLLLISFLMILSIQEHFLGKVLLDNSSALPIT